MLAIIIFQDPTFLSLLNLSKNLHPVIGAYYYRARCGRVNCHPGTHFSAGRQVGLAAVVAATLLQSMDNANKVFPEMATMPIALVILIVCAIGAVIG
ncbi:hypothetical protein ACLB1T_32585 [Escherichia coli]